MTCHSSLFPVLENYQTLAHRAKHDSRLSLIPAITSAIHPSAFCLTALAPIFAYLRSKGYEEFRKKGLVIEGWPVQFIPVASELDSEALAQAQKIEIKIRRK